MKVLINHDTDLDIAAVDGWTPLQGAVRYKHVDVVKVTSLIFLDLIA